MNKFLSLFMFIILASCSASGNGRGTIPVGGDEGGDTSEVLPDVPKPFQRILSTSKDGLPTINIISFNNISGSVNMQSYVNRGGRITPLSSSLLNFST